jgi:hypothetical protein
MAKKDRCANQVFVGYPWKTYRSHWEAAITGLHTWSPLYFIAIGRQTGQPATQLLTKILGAIDRSSMAFFDASAGNPNVALEYGYARATLDETSIYLFRDENATSVSGPGSAIISDLAGAIATQYALNDSRLRDAIDAIAKGHPYVKRFEKFCRQRKYKGGPRRLIVRILRQLDGKNSMLRRELLDNLIHETKKSEAHILKYLKELHVGGLITISKGNEYSSRVHVSG